MVFRSKISHFFTEIDLKLLLKEGMRRRGSCKEATFLEKCLVLQRKVEVLSFERVLELFSRNLRF